MQRDVKNIYFFILWLKKERDVESTFSSSVHRALGNGGAYKSERAVADTKERRINKWKKLEYGVYMLFVYYIHIHDSI